MQGSKLTNNIATKTHDHLVMIPVSCTQRLALVTHSLFDGLHPVMHDLRLGPDTTVEITIQELLHNLVELLQLVTASIGIPVVGAILH